MILVVDDDKRVTDILDRVLTSHGYEVVTCSNGVEAYEQLKSPDCECMLLDIRMPKLNGVELLLLMQSEGVVVPTIVMATFDDFEEKEMKEFANVVRYLPKPFEMDEMLAAIGSCKVKKA